jgi:signal recognition particle receptor subunit beta
MIIDGFEKIIHIKIVYFGPALSGKTTSLNALFNHFGKKKEVCSIESSTRRTLFFDYGNIMFQNKKWKLKIHLYSTTGQDFYKMTRPITMKALDGIIFVVDSQASAFSRNLISWKELKILLDEKLNSMPKIIAFNKQDVINKFDYRKFLEKISYESLEHKEHFFTIALNGESILICFETILSMIFKDIYSVQSFKPLYAKA